MLNKIKTVDDKLIKSIEKWHTPFLNKIMLFMTFLGDGGKVWFMIIALIFFFRKSVIELVCLLLGLGLGLLAAEGIVKRMVCRVRPCHKMDENSLLLKKMPHFYSFPSSHSCTSFAMVSVSFMLSYPIWISFLILVIALGIAFSRFYLQAHYLTDVICGILLGVACGAIIVKAVFLVASYINPAYVD